MNTVHHHPISKASTFKWLLKREYWENRGGFLYAPLIAGAISLVMSLVGILFGLLAMNRAAKSGGIVIDNENVNVNGLDLGLLTQKLDAEALHNLANGLDLTLILSSLWPFIVLAFVVFFYCLGALYDDRRDRSILFWKSLPLSDTQTVLSKALSALLVAPFIAVIASILTMFGFLLIISVVVLTHGGDPMTLIWGPASPLSIVAGHLSWIPVYLLWALPSVGWLLLCSAWARTKPFLWAVMLPLFAGIIVSTTHLMTAFDSTSGWFWKNIVGRLLLGTLPGSDVFYRADQLRAVIGDRDNLVAALAPSNQLAALSLPDIWIGAAVGVVFIILAIRLRRRAGEI
ncbi:ABC-2 transporter permease [Stenotrophomonas sp.]|uniref:ABC-2 transporter permease n=1 Tax=Stenotrophomonas sp. TaxID=69392 RepID=UPI002896BA65|nr:ABC-2 transporter permease [Stenotrophomonas sp.]